MIYDIFTKLTPCLLHYENDLHYFHWIFSSLYCVKSPTYYYLHSNSLLFGLIGLVNDLDTITCPSVSSFGAIAMEFGMDIIVTYGTFSIIYILVTTDVVGDNWCGRFGLWPFRSVAVSVCGRSGLWPFRFVAVPVCGRFGLWPFRFVAVSVCGHFGLWPFRLWPLWPVTVSTALPSPHF